MCIICVHKAGAKVRQHSPDMFAAAIPAIFDRNMLAPFLIGMGYAMYAFASVFIIEHGLLGQLLSMFASFGDPD